MYTVIHFYPTKKNVSEKVLQRIGEQLNQILSGSFDGLSPRYKAFGVAVADSPLWWDHLGKMEAFLKKCGPFIKKIRKTSVKTQFSVAVWRKDYEAYAALGLPLSLELINALAKFGVSIAVRIYYAGDRRKLGEGRRKSVPLGKERELKKANRALREGGAFAHFLHRGYGPV